MHTQCNPPKDALPATHFSHDGGPEGWLRIKATPVYLFEGHPSSSSKNIALIYTHVHGISSTTTFFPVVFLENHFFALHISTCSYNFFDFFNLLIDKILQLKVVEEGFSQTISSTIWSTFRDSRRYEDMIVMSKIMS